VLGFGKNQFPRGKREFNTRIRVVSLGFSMGSHA
jgi:hypothetical protein